VVGAAMHLAKLDSKRLSDNKSDLTVLNVVDSSRYRYEELFDYTASILKNSHGSRILKFHMPILPLRIIGKWQESMARKYGTLPKFASDLIGFFDAPMTMCNNRILSTGYELKWPDTKDAIAHTVDWYLREKWI
jgi:hypothetical protein